MATVKCPMLTSFDSAPGIITAKVLQELRLSSYDRTVGASVSLSCHAGRSLYGQHLALCQPDGHWNFQQKPVCVLMSGDPPDRTTEMPPFRADSLTEEQQIIIGVVVGAGGLVLIVLLVIIVALLCRSRRESQQDKTHRGISTSELYGIRAHSPATQDTQLEAFNYPEFRLSADARSERTITRHQANSISSFPGPPSGRAWMSRDSNQMHTSLPTLLPLSHVVGPGGQGHWERSRGNSLRTSVWSAPSESRRIDVFNRMALLQGHDPFLWRPGSESDAP